MTAYASYNPTALRAGDGPLLSRPIVVASGANAVGAILPRGAVLGMITASGKYVLSALAATDGSQVPVAVLAAELDASIADVQAPAYFTGEFADLMLTYGTGHTAATVDAAFAAAPSGRLLFVRKVGAVA
jgi:hypothetical protein